MAFYRLGSHFYNLMLITQFSCQKLCDSNLIGIIFLLKIAYLKVMTSPNEANWNLPIMALLITL